MKAFILATLLLLAAFVVSQAQGKSQVYGPYPSTNSDDSGTCGQTWAKDTMDRYFFVSQNADGTGWTVVEQFKRGTFVTTGANSPQACVSLVAGISGEFQGKFTIVVTGFAFDATKVPTVNGTPNEVTTKSFIEATFLGATYNVPGASAVVTSFLMNYNAGPNGDWKNASVDKGGNEGDIISIP
jgi:hypothetical protein